MPPTDNDLNDRINELVDKEDAEGLIALLRELSTSDLQANKTALLEASETIFYTYLNDLQLDKIKKEDQEATNNTLWALQLEMEKLAPDQPQFTLRAMLYEHLSGLKPATGEKLHYIQKAIDEYRAELQWKVSPETNCGLAMALITRMEISEKYPEEGLAEILALFQNAFSRYSSLVLIYFLDSSFKLQQLLPADKKHWHKQFVQQIEKALSTFSKEDPYVYLEYINGLTRVPDYWSYIVSDAYTIELKEKVLNLLDTLRDYDTQDPERLNRLGQAFEKACERLGPDVAKLPYYEAALRFFQKGQEINPAAWTFPVYATNVLMAMARIYYKADDRHKVIALFETGEALFARTAVYDNSFTLMLYWGNFLIEYARLGYGFNAPDILKEAEAKLLIAKDQGNGFYSQPYCSLAKIALKTGNKQQCLDILQACKVQFTTDYYEYEHTAVLDDEDFREIWNDLR